MAKLVRIVDPIWIPLGFLSLFVGLCLAAIVAVEQAGRWTGTAAR